MYDTLHFNMRSIVDSRKGGLAGHGRRLLEEGCMTHYIHLNRIKVVVISSVANV